MPNLPPLPTVTQVQYDRLVSGLAGTTAAEKTEAFQVIVMNALIEHVERVEVVKIENAVNAARLAAIAEVQAAMPSRLPYPPDFTTPAKGD